MRLNLLTRWAPQGFWEQHAARAATKRSRCPTSTPSTDAFLSRTASPYLKPTATASRPPSLALRPFPTPHRCRRTSIPPRRPPRAARIWSRGTTTDPRRQEAGAYRTLVARPPARSAPTTTTTTPTAGRPGRAATDLFRRPPPPTTRPLPALRPGPVRGMTHTAAVRAAPRSRPLVGQPASMAPPACPSAPLLTVQWCILTTGPRARSLDTTTGLVRTLCQILPLQFPRSPRSPGRRPGKATATATRSSTASTMARL